MIDGPGIYHRVPFEDYLQLPAINNGGLGLFRRSPKHYKRRPERDSEAMAFGRFVHSGQFEPRTIHQRYCVLPDYNLARGNQKSNGEPSTSWSTEWAQNAKRDFLAANEGKEQVTEQEFSRMMAICEAICDDERANAYLNGPGGRSELTIVWRCELTGLLCKGRIDRQQADGLTDLKTCRDARYFERDMLRYGYHYQAAWYQYGWRVLTGERLPFRFVAIEPDVPFAIRAAPIGESSLQVAYAENDRAITALSVHIEKDYWPGYESPECFEVDGLEEVIFDG